MNALSLLSIACAIAVALSCSCIKPDLQSHFCTSDFTAKVKILSEGNVTADQLHLWFDITVEDVYRVKDNETTVALTFGKLYTPSQSAACGRSFQNGTEYVLTGHQHNYQLSSIICDWGKQVEHLNDDDKLFLDGGFNNVTCTEQDN